MVRGESIQLRVVVPAERAGVRLDVVAAELFPDFSRARLQKWIRGGQLLLDGHPAKPTAKVWGGETLLLEADLRRPRVADYLGVDGSIGLTDVLIDRTVQQARQYIQWLIWHRGYHIGPTGLSVDDLAYDLIAELVSELDGEMLGRLRRALTELTDAADAPSSGATGDSNAILLAKVEFSTSCACAGRRWNRPA